MSSQSSNHEKPNTPNGPSEEFIKAMNDISSDILGTFPEYQSVIDGWNTLSPDKSRDQLLHDHCAQIFPERIFDIFYKNEKIFEVDNEANTEFLPGIDFKYIWNADISDTTKEVLWKYLKIILLITLGNVNNLSDFGANGDMFGAMPSDELKRKLEEMFSHFTSWMKKASDKNSDTDNDGESGSDDEDSENAETSPSFPNVEELHEKMSELMDGKIGKLAMELAKETASDMGLDENDTDTMENVFSKMFNDSKNLEKLFENIKNKIKSKIESGELKESELMEEGMNLMGKVKNMGGMFEGMNIPGMNIPGMGGGKKAKVDTASMDRKLKLVKMRERMKERATRTAAEKMAAQLQQDMISSEMLAVQEIQREEQLAQLLAEDDAEKIKPKPKSKSKGGKKKKGK